MANIFLLPTVKSRGAVWWWLVLFACGQLVLGVCLHRWSLELCDPVYGSRLRSLQNCVRNNPDRPLVLVLGTSRTMNGLKPAAMTPPDTIVQPSPLIFNYAISGSGSVCIRLTYQRLISSGVRPKWLLVETWPLLWPEDGTFDEKRNLVQHDLGWSDLPGLLRYLPKQWDILGKAVSRDLAPLMVYRSRLLQATATSLLMPHVAKQIAGERRDWESDDGTGWIPVRDESEQQRHAIEFAQSRGKPLLNPLRIHPSSDLALRDLLDDCKTYNIRVGLLLMPEHSQCRSWYTPQAKELVRSYLDGLVRDYGIAIMDTRDWLADDDFADYLHMARAAAGPFSERFGREMLYPWLNSKTQP